MTLQHLIQILQSASQSQDKNLVPITDDMYVSSVQFTWLIIKKTICCKATRANLLPLSAAVSLPDPENNITK